MLLEVGRILRAHGVQGEVVVRFTSDRQERRLAGAVVQGPSGPLTLTRSRHTPGGDWVVKYAEVPDRSTAETMHGAILRAESLDDPDELWVHELLGSVVVDQEGCERGVIAEVHEGSASDLLLLDTGHLVPVTFVVGKEPGRILVNTPEGLFDLL